MLRNLVILICVIMGNLSAQTQAEKPAIPDSLTFPTLYLTLAELIADIEAQSNYYASYNPSKIDLTIKLLLPKEKIAIPSLAEVLEGQLDYKITLDEESKKIYILESSYKYISGIIRDSSSLESLTGVAIYTDNNFAVYTNEEGYFNLRIPIEETTLHLSYLGYRIKTYKLGGEVRQKHNINLTYDNRLPDIIISVAEEVPTKESYPINVYAKEYVGSMGVGGTSDLISKVKMTTGVSVGSEAQNGYTVRGGGPDQNLVLLDGLPIFETSHLFGLSSIFMDNTVKKADLYKSGIPARFGNKLSSVLDIRMKDGNRNNFERSIRLGLESISGYLEGPISSNMSIIASARRSVFSLYYKPLLKAYKDIDASLDYDDRYAKVSYWFSPSNRISLSYYEGNDFMNIKSDNIYSNLSFRDNNQIKWRNQLISLNWKKSLSDKIYLHTQLGRAVFDFGSQSSNQVISDVQDTSRLNVVAVSCQENISLSSHLDIFTNSLGKFKLGVSGVKQINRPSILEENRFDGNEIPECSDSSYVSYDLNIFLENNLPLNTKWTINTGLRANTFLSIDRAFLYLQPRINLQYNNGRHFLKVGYSRMNQFLHLLVNPSSGLPSDLWVPSTKDIAPETSNLFSIDYTLSPNIHHSISLGTFYNTYENLIEYTNPTDLFQGIVMNPGEINVDVSNVPWEERISSLSGRSYGLEVGYRGRFEKIKIDVAYTLSRSERSLVITPDSIQNFLYKYDRPHNLSAAINYKLKKGQYLNLSWVFGNGNRWTLPEDKEFINGETRIIAKQRNNKTLSDYHHLNVSYQKQIKLKGRLKLDMLLGVYNIYNKQNPFYSYVLDNPDTPKADAIEIALFPIFPQIIATLTW